MAIIMYKEGIMEVKTMLNVSNTSFEKSNNQKIDSLDNRTVEKIEKVKSVDPIKEEAEIKASEDSHNRSFEEAKENDNNKSFDYDMETNTFLIIVKNEKGEINQYPTEDLLKFKQMLKEEVKLDLMKEMEMDKK